MAARLRPAAPSDYAHFERWFPMLGSGEATPSPQQWRDDLVPASAVAERGGQPVGYCFAQVFGLHGYVRHLVVDPLARRTGAGRALLTDAVAKMRAAGGRHWRLNVREDNDAALGLYRALGLEIHHVCTSLRFPPSLVDTLASAAPACEVVEPDARQLVALEQRFELPPGQLDSVLQRPTGRVLAILGQEAQSNGVATFDLVGQGSFPFRAESLEIAIGLLQALRRYATGPEMGVVSEDLDALTRCLVEAGARVQFRFVHMRGLL